MLRKKLKNINRITKNYLLTGLIIFSFLTGMAFAQSVSKYTVDRNISGNAEKFGEKNSVDFKVLENENKIYSIEIEIEFDVAIPGIKVFDDGSSVIINPFEASLSFYNNQGSEIIKSKIMKDLGVAYERSIYSYISENLIAISLSQPDINYSIIQIYNNQGQLIDNWQLNKNHINGLSFSSIYNILAISVYDWFEDNLKKSTLFIKSDGTEISKIQNDFTNGKFVESENLFIGYTNDESYVYDIEKNKLIFEKTASENEMIILTQYIDGEIFILQTGKPHLGNGKWYYVKPTLNSYNINGKMNLDFKFKCKAFSEFELIRHGSEINFKTENQTLRIQ